MKEIVFGIVRTCGVLLILVRHKLKKKKIPYIQYTRSRGVYSCVTGVRTLGWLRNTAKKVDAKKRQYGLKTQLLFPRKHEIALLLDPSEYE